MQVFDLSKPVTNPDLMKLFDYKKKVDVQKEREKYTQVMNAILGEVALSAKFLCVVEFDDNGLEDAEDGTKIIKKDTQLKFPYLKSGDGQAFLPVYTDWENLKKCLDYDLDKIKTLVMGFDDIVAVATQSGNGAVINPFSDNLILVKEQLEHMATVKENNQKGGATQKVIGQDTQVQIADPDPYPEKLVNAISDYAISHKAIKALYLKLMKNGDEVSFLIVVDVEGVPQQIFDGIANAGRPFLPQGMFIDMVRSDTQLGEQIAANTEPFYTR